MTSLLDREERQTLRRIQTHLREKMRAAQTVVEQIGTVDVYFHPTNPDPYLNCITPHKGVAWVRRDDLQRAFAGLKRLGRVPRLIFQDALFPQAFQQQLRIMGLTPEETRVVMAFRPIYGPDLPGEIDPRGRLPHRFSSAITTSIATESHELAQWLRVFRAGYFNTEMLVVEATAVEALVEARQQGDALFVLAYYQDTPLGAARVGVQGDTAEIEAIAIAPLWHGMGLESALIATAARAALQAQCAEIFTIAPAETMTHLYRNLGFVDLTRALTFWQAEAQASVATHEGEALS